MTWLIVAALSLVDFFYPAREAYRPTWVQVRVAAVVLVLSMVADVFVAVVVVMDVPQLALLPGGLFGSVLCVLIADALWYLFHRSMHSRAFWPLHRWHHAPSLMNIWVYALGHPIFQAAAALVRYLPIWLLGASTAQLFVVGSVQFVWSAFAHVNVRLRIPGLEGFLLGPASHVWHHARGAHVNYGILLGVWDWLGGTLHRSRWYPLRATLGVRDHGPDAWDLKAQLKYPL